MRIVWLAPPIALFLLAAFAGAQDSSPAGRERQTAELLDQVIQPRFLVIDPARGFGVFGTDSRTGADSRTARPTRIPLQSVKMNQIRGHAKKYPGGLQPESAEEKELLAKVSNLKCQYRLGLLHLGYRLDRKTGKHLDSSEPRLELVGEPRSGEPTALRGEIVPHLRQIKRGESLEVENAGWRVFVRPIKSGKSECASCHKGINRGQVMGAMVYLVTASEKTKI